jgi:hypothetical protein
MGRIVAMSGETKFKMTTIQKWVLNVINFVLAKWRMTCRVFQGNMVFHQDRLLLRFKFIRDLDHCVGRVVEKKVSRI